jgi:hypothetical protein
LVGAKSASRGFLGCLAVALVLGLGFCTVAGYLALRKTEERVSVRGFEWERTIAVEAERMVRAEAWQSEVPHGARVLSQHRDVRRTERVQTGTRRVKTGTRDLGNGFFEDVYQDQPVYTENPVYDTRVSYEALRWVNDRTARAEGHDRSPHWPDPRLGSRERESGRTESYVVVLEGKKTYRMKLPQPRWESLQEGEQHQAVIRGGSTVVELR